jgi:two-component system CheB/CheR fusion protein
VQRLGLLLGHRIKVRSAHGRGSVFAVEVQIPRDVAAARVDPSSPPTQTPTVLTTPTATILVVEDDPEVRELLDLLLRAKGYRVVTVAEGVAANDAVENGQLRPDLILADYNLPNGMNGLQVAARLREACGRSVPVIVLTGDISSATLRAIALQNCTHLHKPMKPAALLAEIERLLTGRATEPEKPPNVTAPKDPTATIHIVDDDAEIRRALRAVLEAEGWRVADFDSCEAFLAAHTLGEHGCLLIDAYLPGMTGLQLLDRLAIEKDPLPAIMITGNSDVAVAVAAMKAGACDFIEKPVTPAELIASIGSALERSRDAATARTQQAELQHRFDRLTQRQRQILALVLAGHPSKNIAADLGISQRTVENHRAAIMQKSGARSLPGLARLALASSQFREG